MSNTREIISRGTLIGATGAELLTLTSDPTLTPSEAHARNAMLRHAGGKIEPGPDGRPQVRFDPASMIGQRIQLSRDDADGHADTADGPMTPDRRRELLASSPLGAAVLADAPRA